MSQPEESAEKTTETDAVLMHPGNDPHRETAEVAPLDEPGQVRVERNGGLTPLDPAGVAALREGEQEPE